MDVIHFSATVIVLSVNTHKRVLMCSKFILKQVCWICPTRQDLRDQSHREQQGWYDEDREQRDRAESVRGPQRQGEQYWWERANNDWLMGRWATIYHGPVQRLQRAGQVTALWAVKGLPKRHIYQRYCPKETNNIKFRMAELYMNTSLSIMATLLTISSWKWTVCLTARCHKCIN